MAYLTPAEYTTKAVAVIFTFAFTAVPDAVGQKIGKIGESRR